MFNFHIQKIISIKRHKIKTELNSINYLEVQPPDVHLIRYISLIILLTYIFKIFTLTKKSSKQQY